MHLVIHRITFFLLAFGLNVAVAADNWKAAVLKAKEIIESSSDTLIIELVSGETVRVLKKDWSQDFSTAVDEAVKNQQNEQAVKSSANPPSDTIASSLVRSKCADEWPDDFSMRKYCEDQQNKSLRVLRSRSMDGPLAKVRQKCADDWPRDFGMRDYCEKGQLTALQELSK